MRYEGKKIVCVWPEDGQWIVSVDRVAEEYGPDSNTGAISTRTVDVCSLQDDAVEEGRELAKKLGVECYAQDENGVPSLC